MASLFFTCPTTHQKVATGIEIDVQSLQPLGRPRSKSNAHTAARYTKSQCARRISLLRYRMLRTDYAWPSRGRWPVGPP
jgi:hypothetical protein